MANKHVWFWLLYWCKGSLNWTFMHRHTEVWESWRSPSVQSKLCSKTISCDGFFKMRQTSDISYKNKSKRFQAEYGKCFITDVCTWNCGRRRQANIYKCYQVQTKLKRDWWNAMCRAFNTHHVLHSCIRCHGRPLKCRGETPRVFIY